MYCKQHKITPEHCVYTACLWSAGLAQLRSLSKLGLQQLSANAIDCLLDLAASATAKHRLIRLLLLLLFIGLVASSG